MGDVVSFYKNNHFTAMDREQLSNITLFIQADHGKEPHALRVEFHRRIIEALQKRQRQTPSSAHEDSPV